jgi:hypothetical protein
MNSERLSLTAAFGGLRDSFVVGLPLHGFGGAALRVVHRPHAMSCGVSTMVGIGGVLDVLV